MARKLKLVDSDAPTEGHNSGNIPVDQDHDKYIWLKNQIIEAENNAAEKKLAHDSAKKIVDKTRKTFEAHGGSLFEFDLARELADMENPDMARSRLARLIQYLTFEGIELPHDTLAEASKDPYAGLPEADVDHKKWFERGRVAALSGKGAFAGEKPEHCPIAMFDSYSKGVIAGQTEIASRMSAAGPLFASAAANDTPEDEETEGEDDGLTGKHDHIMGSVLNDLAGEYED